MTDGAAKVIEVRAQLVSEDTAHVLAALARGRSTGRGSKRADLPSASGHGPSSLCDSALSPTAWLSPFSAKSLHPDWLLDLHTTLCTASPLLHTKPVALQAVGKVSYCSILLFFFYFLNYKAQRPCFPVPSLKQLLNILGQIHTWYKLTNLARLPHLKTWLCILLTLCTV